MKPLRKLSLLATVLLALAGAGASSASAATNFVAEEYAAEIKGLSTESQSLTLEGPPISCKKATFVGEMYGPAETLSLAPTYTECVMVGTKTTIEANGCTFVLHGGTEEGENVFGGTTEIACPKEQSIKILSVGNKCEAKIGAQTGLTSTTYQDNPESKPLDVTLKEKLTGIHYTITKDEGPCPFPGTGEKTNGALSGNSLLKAFSEEAQVAMQVKKAGNAKLCTEAPKAGVCPAGKAYPEKTPIQGAESGLGAASIYLYEGAVPKVNIICEQSIITGENKEEVGNPEIRVEKLSITFAVCKDKAGTGNECVVEMSNAPATAGIWAAMTSGEGILEVAMTLSLECGSTGKCRFGTLQENINISGEKNAMKAERVTKFSKIEGGATCYEQLRWYGYFEVIEPNPLWVTT